MYVCIIVMYIYIESGSGRERQRKRERVLTSAPVMPLSAILAYVTSLSTMTLSDVQGPLTYEQNFAGIVASSWSMENWWI
jgi:hypothetical protein